MLSATVSAHNTPGRTTIVTTQGTGQRLPAARLDINYFARYLGWAPV